MKSAKLNVRKISFFILLIVVYILTNLFVTNSTKSNSYLTNAWEITDQTHSYSVDSLSDAKFKLKKGDSLTLKTTLPAYEYTHPMIKLWFYHCAFTVNVDGNTIYTSGIKEQEQKSMVPNGVFFVPLPENAHGKTLEIQLTSIANTPFTSLPDVAIQNESVLMKNYFKSNSVQIGIGCFLLIAGFLLMIMKLFSSRKSFFSVKIIFITFLCFITSLWLFISSGLIRNLFGSFPFLADLEYLLLYLTPIVIAGYIMERQQNEKYRKICKILMIVLGCFVLSATLSSLLHIMIFADVLMLFHVLAFVTLGLLLWFTIHNYKVDHNYSERLFLFGMATMIVLLIVDLVKFNITKYFTTVSVDTADIIVPVSILVLVFSMLVSSVESILKTYQDTIETVMKDKLTYIDGLTGISNRMKCTEYLDSTSDTAAVISFDITHLKEVNELYGHSHGDIYLKSFAECLKNVFEKAELIGRIGEDEFVVIQKDVTKEQVEKEVAYLADLTKVAVPDETCPLCFGHSVVMSEDSLLWEAYEEALAKMSK